ncbi:MAG: hypothetical protein GAK37_02654 [Pseudomonas sp.]|nr:MAG: hypothetical protein GAK37_02654 [Pseudomonas sp.]
MVYEVRFARPADIEAISQVILAALYASNARDYPIEVIAQVAANFTPQAVRELLKRRSVLVATYEQAVIATAALETDLVRSVFVSPGLQGRGVGRLLMHEIERLARESGVAALSVPSSVTAEAFYTRLGYHPVREVYHGDERTVVMCKTLQD